MPTILLVDTTAGLVEPPAEAFNVFLQIDRKDTLTARSDRLTTQQQDAQMVNLVAMSSQVGNRLFGRRLDNNSTISVKFAWRVDLTTRTALKWGSVLIGLNWYVLDLSGEKGSKK